MAEPVSIPTDLADVVDETMTFEPAALQAVRALARTKPWQGSFDKRCADLQTALRALCEAYELPAWQAVHVGRRAGCSGGSHLAPRLKRIVLTGRLSVVTLLHLFAKARWGANGPADHVRALKWSVNLFRRCFPRSFARCRLVGGLLVNDGRRDD